MQLVVVAGVVSVRPTLLTITVAISLVAFWLGRRFAPLYLRLVEHELVKHQDTPQFSLVSEAGWTLVPAPVHPPSTPALPAIQVASSPVPLRDPVMATLV